MEAALYLMCSLQPNHHGTVCAALFTILFLMILY